MMSEKGKLMGFQSICISAKSTKRKESISLDITNITVQFVRNGLAVLI